MIPKAGNQELRSCDWLKLLHFSADLLWKTQHFFLSYPTYSYCWWHMGHGCVGHLSLWCWAQKPFHSSGWALGGRALADQARCRDDCGEACSPPASHEKFEPCDAMQLATCTMVLAFSCLLERLLLLSFWRFKTTSRKQTWRVIDVVAPKTPKPRNWKRAVVIYICSTPRKDICSIILKGFWVTRSVM